MTARPFTTPQDQEQFVLSGQTRKIIPIPPRPWRWPTQLGEANRYVSEWKNLAGSTLSRLKLSKKTLDVLASHVSRRDGTLQMTNQAIAARISEGRSISSVDRDIQRLKTLGFLTLEHFPAKGRQGRERLVKLSLPDIIFEPQRIPPENQQDCTSTYPPYVEAIDMGERRNV